MQIQHSMFYKFHSKSPWLKRVLVPFWAFQIIFMLVLITILFWLPAWSGLETYVNPPPLLQLEIWPQLSLTRINSTNILILIISALCIVLSITEIILYAATRLHPLTYLILQLVKMTIWGVLLAIAVYKLTVLGGVKAEEEAGLVYFFLQGFVETLVLL